MLAEGVDLEEISLKYEITGGYIRNAVLAALLSAVSTLPLTSSPSASPGDALGRGAPPHAR